MEYKAYLLNSYQVKCVITKEAIEIEVHDEKNGNHLNWSLDSKSLLAVQMYHGIIRDLPYQLAAAININKLEKKEEFGYHVLAASQTTLIAVGSSEQSVSTIFLKNELEDICAYLKYRMTETAYSKAKALFIKLQPVEIACHVYLYFAYGEYFTVTTLNVEMSAVNKELWTSIFNLVPCSCLIENFKMACTMV